jgi:GNAT superfamily N-acetyltransferase
VSSREKVRIAERGDIPAITEIFSLAFQTDPTWSWAFPDPSRRPEQYRVWWGRLVEGAMRFSAPAVFVTEGLEAAALWLPPGEAELGSADDARTPEVLAELLGDRAGEVLELLERFEAAQPEDPPHYYLSLLGVHDDHRGKGIGMRLLAENIARFDAEGVPTYLESSNSANNHRSEKLGYRRIADFTTPGDTTTVTAYWREPLTG